MVENRPKSFLPHLNHRRYLVLLLSLLLLSVLFPSFEGKYAGGFGFNILFTLMLLAATLAASDKRATFVCSAILAVAALFFRWLDYGGAMGELTLLHYGMELAFLGWTTFVVLQNVLSSGRIHADRIFGAICVYLLIGVIWAVMYSMVSHVDPDSFEGAHSSLADERILNKRESFQRLLYYSYITLSTLGYGDIVPKSVQAQTLSWLEAVTGQLYLTILVARLVGLYITHEATHSQQKR